MAGRRRSSSGSYNPLADKAVEATGLDTWTCVAETTVQLHQKPSVLSPEAGICKVGEQISAEKEGDWLKMKDTGLYAPYMDKNGNRLFKNERLTLMERATSGEGLDGPTRASSRSSISSKGSNSSSKRSNSSGDGAIVRRQSFRWVDTEGISRRLAGDSELLKNMNVRPEVWICVAEQSVPYHSSPALDDVCGKQCVPGSKVTAVKEDDWLKVMEVKESFDALNAAEMIGRRSLKSSTRVTLIDTGLYLPFFQDGQRLFKNEKVVLWEAAQDGQKVGSPTDKGSCSVM